MFARSHRPRRATGRFLWLAVALPAAVVGLATCAAGPGQQSQPPNPLRSTVVPADAADPAGPSISQNGPESGPEARPAKGQAELRSR
ncbi:MAG: hypothetical protein AAF467_16010 [Actinomycetota bacterium]